MSAPLLRYVPGRLTTEQLTALRVLAASERPTFAHRLAQPVMVEQVENPWFAHHQIYAVQSPPMPAMGIIVAGCPDGSLQMLSGHPASINDLAARETIVLGDEAALPYANVTANWTRASEWPEFPIDCWADIPWRTPRDEAAIESVQGVASRIQPRSFARRGTGWRQTIWLVSSSRLLHRIVDVEPNGIVAIADEIVASELPVPPGKAWGQVGNRVVPIG